MARRVFILLLSLFTFIAVMADEETFRVLGPAQGLKGRNVLQMTQLKDGRMAVVTNSHVCFYNGKNFQCVPKEKNFVYPLRGYNGFTHIYIDHNNNFWLKDWQTVACLNLKTLHWEKLNWKGSPRLDDLFADSKGSLWIMNGNNIVSENGVRLQRPDTAMVQDVDVVGNNAFVFTDNGIVSLYNAITGKYNGSYVAYGKDEADKYNRTSLVVNGNDGNFYQIRTGEKSILISFNIKSHRWQRLLDVDYILHTLIVSLDNKSKSPKLYVSCEKGYWIIDTKTGEQHLLTVLRLPDADGKKNRTIQTGYNTICQDKDGGIWLGSYDRGLLYASPESGIFEVEVDNSWKWIAIIIVVIVVALALGLWWRKRQKAVKVQSVVGPQPANETMTSSEDNSLSDADKSFLDNARQLVIANMSNTDYSVAQLASDLCMERTGLYKKMTAITGQSPVVFIRSIRLERAAELIKAGGHSISEVSELTGFGSPGYFTKCFQKQYGCLPSEY